MPIDPKSIVPGKKYVTATRHVRTVLEVTTDRIRYAYGGGEAGGVSQWRWQTITKFAEDAVNEVGSEDEPASAPAGRRKAESEDGAEAAPPSTPKKPGARPTLSTRKS